MKKISKSLQLLLVTTFFSACTNSINENTTTLKPPIAEKKDSVMTIHGDTRIDPYFWMRLTDEQKIAQNPDEQTLKVLNYLNAENEYKSEMMKTTEDFQTKLYDEIVGRIKKTDESVPYFLKGYWYYSRYEEGKEYPIYARKKESLEADEQIILNVNGMAEGFGYYSASGLNVSPNNDMVVFGEDTLSRRIYSLRFKDLDTGRFLDDEIPNTSGHGAWSNDGQYYFYTTKNTVSLLSEKIWRHKLGTPIDEDVLVYEEKDPSYYIGVYNSKSDKFIIIYNSSTLVSDYHVLDADNPTGEFRQFIPRGEKHEYSIAHFEDKFYILTNWDAQNFRLMETPADATDQANWKEVIAHRDDVLLEGIDLFKNHMVVDERKSGLINLRIINQKTGKEHYMEFDESAYTAYTTTNVEFDTDVLRFGYQSMTTPNSTYDYNMNTKERELKKQTEVVGGHNPEDYYTERIWATARDGVKVPISVVYKKGFEKNAQEPLLLYAYGSYGNTIDAYFSSTRLSLLDRGFGFAVAHIRGGQMMGRQWYEDGKMFKKQNTFNDFVDCARYLIDEKYTSTEHLYAQGGSAGGLLMGAIYNMNPELFNGVLAAVPFVDVVNTMLDENIPLTTGEFDEWGNPKDKDSYEYMLSYSPYDQVEAKEYTNMLVTTGLFDSQVQYWEPAKWVAKLRDMKTDNNVLIMDCDMEAGHGGASGRFKKYRTTALQYAFLLDLEGIKE
ncbi:MAG: S9 family peptidase [Cytophagales bacterium]|nr:S9 family peptidase [Cytophagales bacterium]